MARIGDGIASPHSARIYSERIAELSTREAYYGLPGNVYSDAAIYDCDMAAIWREGWVFVGHTCQLAQPGDYLTLQVDHDPILVARGDDGQIRAFHNVCSHRGTLLCAEASGHANRWVCPYHQWVYDTRGRLATCRGMGASIDKGELGLRPITVRQLAGFVFVSLSSQPADFDLAAQAMRGHIQPQGLEHAKVAACVDYVVRANWKLVWENNRECYHCNANHPQYIRANYDHFNEDDADDVTLRRMADALERHQSKWQSSDWSASHHQTGMATFPDAHQGLWYAANRTVLAEGYVSESMDGNRVAPLMGDYTEPDVGTLRVRTLPNMWNHSSCDHAVTTRLLPAGPEKTHIQVTWMVHADAVEGRDYQLHNLMPFWQLTSEQDWELCERVQQGVRSSGYRPGPLSRHKEYNVESFLVWYVQSLRQYAGG